MPEVDRRLRAMRPEDLAQVADLHQLLDPSYWNQSQWHEALKHYPQAWVVDIEGVLAGYVLYQARTSEAELLNLGVNLAFQGQGLGTELICSSISLLPAQIETVFLEVRRSNLPAIGLYEKIGFECVGERPGYYRVPGGIREDALIYRYDLPIQC